MVWHLLMGKIRNRFQKKFLFLKSFRDNDEEIIANVINKTIDFGLLPKISMECREALTSMLERDPRRRISAAELLQHPWIKVCCILF